LPRVAKEKIFNPPQCKYNKNKKLLF